MLQPSRKAIGPICAALLAALAGLSAGAAAQGAVNFPNKPIRIVLPFAVGGATTIVGTIFSQPMAADWGQSVLLDNRAGANTIIGSEVVARAQADGYILLGTTGTHIINALLQPKLPYDTFKDFAPITTLTRADFTLVLNPKFEPATLKDFIAYAKQNPGKVNITTDGPGTIQPLIVQLFMEASGTQLTMVSYKGGGPATSDVVAGVAQANMSNPANFASLIKSGKLKGIAVSGDHRKPSLPNVPTFTEAGLPSFNSSNWMALIAPAGTPRDIIQKINAEVARLQARDDVKQAINNQAIDPYPNSVAATEALFRADYERYGKVIRDKNIKADPVD